MVDLRPNQPRAGLADRLALVQAAFRGRIARARYARLRITAKGRPLRYYALKIQVPEIVSSPLSVP